MPPRHEALATVAAAVRRGERSAEECVQTSLDRIATLDPEIGAFLTVLPVEALDRARKIDKRRAAGEPLGTLAGVAIAVKDNICTRGIATTAGSKILTADGDVKRGYRPPYNASVVDRLLAEDAIIVGKTNLDEFAMGSSNENSGFNICRNPRDLNRAPGGSSGGSAASVAAGMTSAALGSDTGGSIRQPASFCGVVGMKPTYGRISRYGLIAFASSLDQIGPLTPDVASAQYLYQALAGPDPRDSTSAPETSFERSARPVLRVGLPEEYFDGSVDEIVAERVRRVLQTLEQDSAPGGPKVTLHPISLPLTKYALSTYYVLATAEASANLARFDGVRFGLRKESARSLRGMYEASRGAGFGPEVKRRIVLGTFVLSAGYYDAFYAKANRVRRAISHEFQKAFESVDVIAGPVSPTVAFRLGERTDEPLSMYSADTLTLPASLAGLPAMSVPVGDVRSDGAGEKELPTGLQLITPPFSEARLFQAGMMVEAAAKNAGYTS